MQVLTISYHSPSGVFFTVNGRRIPSSMLLVSMADKRHQKTIAKGIGC